MASSVSPPSPHHASLPNPKKRPSLATPSAPTSSYALKRPKLHPLRQTSFPVENAAPFSATPSARSETGSLVSASSRPGALGSAEKRGRGRPKKNAPTPHGELNSATGGGKANDRDDAGTLVSGTGAGAGVGRGSRSVISGRSGGGDDDDEGEAGGWAAAPENLDAGEKARKDEEDREENRKLLRLMSTFTPEQEHRHRMYKRAYLNKSTLKRIVNQTVSQSVTALPLIAIGAYGKYFVGEIVTRALDVQKEWADAFERGIEIERARKRDKENDAEDRGNGVEGGEKDKGTLAEDQKPKNKKPPFVPNPHKGGLLPDHLREALRRYKGDGEGGGVGFGNTSLAMMGVQGAGTWRVGNGVGARRLFR